MEVVFDFFDPSLALQDILWCSGTEILTRTRPDLPPYLGLEALAQTCGLHLRRRHEFLVQVYLASMARISWPKPTMPVRAIHAVLTEETATAARYLLDLNGGPGGEILLSHRALKPENPARTFFQERFRCLRTRSWHA